NGALRDLDLTIEPQYGPEGRICGITCAAMDVSDRKLLEKERAQAERSRLLEAFFTSTITPLVFLDRDFKFIRVNEAFAGTCRRDASEFAGRSYFEFFPGKEKEEIFRKAVETKIPFRAFADVFHCPNEPKWGELCWNWNLTPILEPGGEVEFLVLALNDVTEQTRAQENIRRSEELLRTVMELLPVGVCVFDREGKVRQCNPVGDKILGDAENLSPGPFMSGRAWRTDSGQSVGPEEWGPVRAIRQGEPSFNEELEIEAPDGVRKALLASTVPLRDEGGGIPGAVVVIEDITGRKRAETVFRQQQKMEALGTLAGGIAHDLNNMLNPIVINTELALMDIKEGKTPAPQFLQLVLKSAERGRKLVNQVITFSRQKDQARMKLDIAPLVREGLKFLRSSLPSNIEVRKKLDTGGLQVLADPTQIQQVLSNLVSNAAYAMREEGGTLGVSLEVVDVDPETAAGVAGLKPAPYLRLTVSDTGHGMDKETLEKAFNPFFTTKS
ncbi:MAG TPA: PAS domain-containing protein, partial [Candidatus Acidoferrum sp.]|nr:PAS domain-containing protein [Candidatus Acidoferrum sp.]